MNEKKEDYSGTIANAYLCILFLLYPLYMQKGFVQIGQVKYVFYRNISFVFLAISIFYFAVGVVAAKKMKGSYFGGWQAVKNRMSMTDWFVLGYGMITVVAAIFSRYHRTAIWGYSGWNMGMITQLLMIFGYFLVSRWYDGGQGACWFGALGSLAVSLLVVCNRVGFDPIGVYGNWGTENNNRKDLLATIGHLNWVCSYLAVMVPLLLYFYHVLKGWRKLIAGGSAVIGLLAILLQGSMSGFAVLAVILIVWMFLSLNGMRQLGDYLKLIIVFTGCCLLMKMGNVTIIAPSDMDNMENMIYGFPWGVVFMPLLVLLLIIELCGKKRNMTTAFWRKARRLLAYVLTGVLLLCGILFILCQISEAVWNAFGNHPLLRINDEWGTMRGALWRISTGAYLNAPWKIKLLGVGPDAFADHMYEQNVMGVLAEGMWQDVIFANAHNEWLTMLLNEGVVGLLFYVGIWITAIVRYSRKVDEVPLVMIGLLSVMAYEVNAFFSFQQVVSTPLIFLILGLCENALKCPEACKNN